jgi:hypothetical protein
VSGEDEDDREGSGQGRKKNPKPVEGAALLFCPIGNAAVWLEIGLGFLVLPPQMFKITLLVLSCGPIFIGKMLLMPQNWFLNFLFL